MTNPRKPATITPTTITASAFTSALSQAANGVSIVTTAFTARRGEPDTVRRAGLTVSSHCSVCAEPALLLVCVNADNEFCDLITESCVFAVNILAEGQQRLSNVFAGLEPVPGDERFATGNWMSLQTGSPILSDALVALDCELESRLRKGTHEVFFGHVVDVRITHGQPLVYTDRGYAATRAFQTPQ